MNNHSPSLFKQLGGALVGALVALGVYALYYQSADGLTAYLFPPGVQTADEFPDGYVRLAETEIVGRADRLNARAKEIREQMIALRTRGAAPQTNDPTVSAQPRWVDPGHDEQDEFMDEDAVAIARAMASAPSIPAPVPSIPLPPLAAQVTAMPEKEEENNMPPPNLPSSGTTMNILVALALSGALVLRRKQIKGSVGYTAS